MNQMRLRKLAIAGSAFACAALFSFSWSEQSGVSLSVESAQARVGRPLTPVSVAGVARRQNRRAGYGYAAGGAGELPSEGSGGLNAYSAGPLVGTGYSTGGAWGANAYYAPSAASPSGWYISSGGMACTSGMWVTGGNGLPFLCP